MEIGRLAEILSSDPQPSELCPVLRHFPASKTAILAAAMIGSALGASIAGTVAAAAVPSSVMQVDKAFKPVAMTVKVGEIIAFLNDDVFDHNVYSESRGNEFDSGIQEPGETVEMTFNSAGDVVIYCRIHPKMKMTVRVE